MLRGSVLSRAYSLPSSKIGMDSPSPMPLNPGGTLLPDHLEKSFIDFDSQSCSEFDPPSSDSIFDESDIFGLQEKSHLDSRSSASIDPTTDPWSPRNLMHIPIRNLLRVKKDISCDLTLGDAVQEIFLHLQPSLASTIKEVLMENTSSHYMSSIDETLSMASENLISDDPHDSSLVQLNYGVDEEMKEMKKILDNPWNTDETIDLARLQIETMDSWKKDFGRLNKILEEKKEIQSVEDAWDDAVPNQNSGAISTNQTSQVQPNSPVQAKRIETILTPKKNQATSRKLFRIWIFSSFITILIIASMMIFVVLELDYYKSHTAEAMWIERHNRFFLSSTFV